LPVGRYAVAARAPTEAMVALPSVETGADAVTLVLPAKGQIVGTVEGFAGDVRVTAIDSVGRDTSGILQGNQFHIDGVQAGTASVMAYQRGVEGSRLDIVQVTVVPPARAEVTLRRRSTYKLTGVLVDDSGAPSRGNCEIMLKLNFGLASLAVGADGQFATEIPVGLAGTLFCSTAHEAVSRPLPDDAAAGTTVVMTVAASTRPN
jgi:hypothetical protein